MGFSWVEKIVLLTLFSASTAAFCYRLAAVLRTILRSKRDAGFELRPLGPRIGRLFREVLLQALVIRQRPLAGLAHALVFWGFCVFALVTLDHFAALLGLAFLPPQGFYSRFAAVFALAVAASIAALAFRRFVVRPRWLGPLSPESGLIAFLIFALMATYLIAFRFPQAGRVAWWAHSLALLAFIPVIPHTKHLHLVLSPFSTPMPR